jgi:GTP cyclohydrolase IA
MSVDTARLEAIGHDLLSALGQDTGREGLLDTPRRWAAWWKSFIEFDPGNCDTTFESVITDQMVVVSGIRVWSLCEHHLLPFWCDVSIGYLTKTKVLGLSKFARIAKQCAHKLQLQERLCHEIADEIARLTDTEDVAVLAVGQHLCMEMRGPETQALTKTSVMRGHFRESHESRAEFLSLVEKK